MDLLDGFHTIYIMYHNNLHITFKTYIIDKEKDKLKRKYDQLYRKSFLLFKILKQVLALTLIMFTLDNTNIN